MDDDLKAFYRQKKIIDYCNYKIVIFETTVKSIDRFVISIFQGSKKIGEFTTDNDADGIKNIKARIDKSEENGAQLIFIKP